MVQLVRFESIIAPGDHQQQQQQQQQQEKRRRQRSMRSATLVAHVVNWKVGRRYQEVQHAVAIAHAHT
jgi:hypothetical protein